MHPEGNAFLTGPYDEDEYFSDLMRVTGGETNEELARFTIRTSQDLGEWMQQSLPGLVEHREFLGNLVRYFRVLTDALEFDLEVGKKQVAMASRVTDLFLVDQRQVVECELGLFHRFCQLITGRQIRLSWVAFRHDVPTPEEARTVKEIFGAPVRYGQSRNAVALEAVVLDYPIETADNDLLKILKHHCQLILGTRPQVDDFVFRVQQSITNLLPSGHPKIDAVAREFGMSARTLTRRLAAYGHTYKGLVDEVRRKLALQYLQDKRISVKNVAYLLGYSEVPAFYHAFQRWTGSSPVQQRLTQ